MGQQLIERVGLDDEVVDAGAEVDRALRRVVN